MTTDERLERVELMVEALLKMKARASFYDESCPLCGRPWSWWDGEPVCECWFRRLAYSAHTMPTLEDLRCQ